MSETSFGNTPQIPAWRERPPHVSEATYRKRRAVVLGAALLFISGAVFGGKAAANWVGERIDPQRTAICTVENSPRFPLADDIALVIAAHNRNETTGEVSADMEDTQQSHAGDQLLAGSGQPYTTMSLSAKADCVGAQRAGLAPRFAPQHSAG